MAISVTYTFSSGNVISSSEVNSNFSTLATKALDKTGDTITGTIAVTAGITIGGVDLRNFTTTGDAVINSLRTSSTGAGSLTSYGGVSAGPSGGVGIIGTDGKIPALSTTYLANLSAANLTSIPAANLTGTAAAINGANITALNATQLTSGTVPNGAFPATLPAASGINLTALNATNLGSGTVPTARLGSGSATSSTVLRGDNTWGTVSAIRSITQYPMNNSVGGAGNIDITVSLTDYTKCAAHINGRLTSSGIFTVAQLVSNTVFRFSVSAAGSVEGSLIVVEYI